MAKKRRLLFRARKRIKDKLRGIGTNYARLMTKTRIQEDLDSFFGQIKSSSAT